MTDPILEITDNFILEITINSDLITDLDDIPKVYHGYWANTEEGIKEAKAFQDSIEKYYVGDTKFCLVEFRDKIYVCWYNKRGYV